MSLGHGFFSENYLTFKNIIRGLHENLWCVHYVTINILSNLLVLTNLKAITTQRIGVINISFFQMLLNTLPKIIHLINEDSIYAADSGEHCHDHSTVLHTGSHTNTAWHSLWHQYILKEEIKWKFAICQNVLILKIGFRSIFLSFCYVSGPLVDSLHFTIAFDLPVNVGILIA